MTNPLKVQVSADRRKRGNPYAHIEYLEEFAANTPIQAKDALAHEIAISRKRLEDPYAHLQGDGGYSGLSFVKAANPLQDTTPKPPRKVATRGAEAWTDGKIDALVNEIHVDIWRNRFHLWEGTIPEDPVELLDPERALWLKGYDFAYEDALGEFRDGGRNIEVAGYIDQASKKVRVSRMLSLPVSMFTAAHELGHALLHPTAMGVHRDRPLDGARIARDVMEQQADKFAARFLMPARLLRTRFTSQFGDAPFFLNEETAFALCSESLFDVRSKFGSLRDLSRTLAKAERYNGRAIVSLATQFRVSVETTAIRLEELNLVEY